MSTVESRATVHAADPTCGSQPESRHVSQPVRRFNCGINCGSACLLAVRPGPDGIDRVVPELPAGATGAQGPCRIGLSMIAWQASPERLTHPLRRVGPRGSGRFTRISWDEALDLLAERLRHTIDTYGNESIYVSYGTGVHAVTGNAHKRLLNLLGGHLRRVYDYSTHMVQASMPFMFGADFSPYAPGFSSSYSSAYGATDLMLLFGDNPVETRRGPLGQRDDFQKVAADIRSRGGQVIHVDCRRNGSVGSQDEWIPLVPGTDAALVAALAWQLIHADAVDTGFLHRFCVGYDEQTMPAAYRGQHASYRDYVLGQGPDGVAKTPLWAQGVCGVPAARIERLAEQLACARNPFIGQGWGVQRHANGEVATRAISVLACLVGAVGRPGTNTGQRPEESPVELVAALPEGDNPCPAGIPAYEWLNAVEKGSQLTCRNAGVTGVERLSCGIKFLWNHAGNCLTNQHGDINHAHAVLSDEGACEFIVAQDTVMTDSARYADLVLPDVMRCEQLSLRASGFSAYAGQVLLCPPAFEAPGECRSSYDVMADLAGRFGLRQAFTEGLSEEEWICRLYGQARTEHPDLPTWEDLLRDGAYRRRLEPEVGLEAFVVDPKGHPLATPSGKIEIFSAQLADLALQWELADGQQIAALPVYEPEQEGRIAALDGTGSLAATAQASTASAASDAAAYPLHCIGWHDRMRVHSSFGFADAGGKAAAPVRHRLWMNPADAGARGIVSGDRVKVRSQVGEVHMTAQVTADIVAGTVGMPQGAWYRPAIAATQAGADVPADEGGCINTLTAYRPTPLAKGNGAANAARVQVLPLSE